MKKTLIELMALKKETVRVELDGAAELIEMIKEVRSEKIDWWIRTISIINGDGVNVCFDKETIYNGFNVGINVCSVNPEYERKHGKAFVTNIYTDSMKCGILGAIPVSSIRAVMTLTKDCVLFHCYDKKSDTEIIIVYDNVLPSKYRKK